MQNIELENQMRMMDVVRSMKEIPELPSEAPKDVQTLERVEFPDAGGVLTYMSEQPFPYKGFPFFEFVDKIDILKKISRAVLSGMYHQLKNKKILFVTLIPALWLLKPVVRTFFYVIYRVIDRFKLKKEKYCDAVREVYRAFSHNTEFSDMFRDLLCMVLEMDNAYRYRFQDIIIGLDKTVLRASPRTEIVRLLQVLSEREKGQDIKDTWFLVKLALSFYLFVDKEFKNLIVDSLCDLDLEKVQLSIEDKAYCVARSDYRFDFVMTPRTEIDKKIIQYNKDRIEFNTKRTEIQDNSTKSHQELFKKHDEAQKLISINGDTEKISKEINEKITFLKTQLETDVNILINKTNAEERQIINSYLTEEQRKLADEQQKEVEAMNSDFTTQLQTLQTNYHNELKRILSQ